MPLTPFAPVASHPSTTAPAGPTPLGPEDYQALYTLSVSDDPTERQLAQHATSKMTPQEYQQFFDMQKQQGKDAPAGSPAKRGSIGIGNPSSDTDAAFVGTGLASPLRTMVTSGVKAGAKAGLDMIPPMAKTAAKVGAGAYAAKKVGLPPYIALALLAPELKGSLGRSVGRAVLGDTEVAGPAAADAVAPAASAPAESTSATAGGLTAEHKAILNKQGYPPELITKIERMNPPSMPSPSSDAPVQLRTPVSAHAPTAEPAPVSEPPKPGLLSDVHRVPTRANILSDKTTFDLAQEAMPGVRLKSLKAIPMPAGDSLAAKALRQRAHIEKALQAAQALKKGG